MAYFLDITVPRNTSIADSQESILQITSCRVNKVRILHPTGCVGLVGVSLYYRSARLWPINDSGWFTGNGGIIEFFPNKLLNEPPFDIIIKTYNLDEAFNHTISIMLDIEFIKGVSTSEVSSNALSRIIQFFEQ